jgi:hypothetical protein
MRKLRKIINYFLLENINSDVWFHGSNELFTKFKTKNGTLHSSTYQSPIFLSSDYNFAKSYTGNPTPVIYKVKILTDNLLDFRTLPFVDEINHNSPSKIDTVAINLINYIEDNWDSPNINFYWSYPEKVYSYLLSGEHSEIERIWVLNWLKLSGFDGAYIIETNSLNCFIFNPDLLKIIDYDKL